MKYALYLLFFISEQLFISILLAFYANKKLLERFFFKKIKKNKNRQKIVFSNVTIFRKKL